VATITIDARNLSTDEGKTICAVRIERAS